VLYNDAWLSTALLCLALMVSPVVVELSVCRCVGRFCGLVSCVKQRVFWQQLQLGGLAWPGCTCLTEAHSSWQGHYINNNEPRHLQHIN
jgi:hypothetical protein